MTQRRAAARVLWTLVAIAIGVWLLVSLISGAVNGSKNSDAKHDAQERAQFWNAIEGRGESGVAGKLAEDIRAHLKADHRVQDFRGDSNAYGGVKDALGGFDPFDESCGSECGHLTTEVQRKALQSYEGDAEGVITAERPDTSSGRGAKAPFIMLGVWLLLGSAVAMVPVWRRQRDQEAVGQQYPHEYLLTQKLDQAIRELPEGQQRDELANLRAGLGKAITKRVMSGNASTQEARVARLATEAKEALVTFDEGNKALGE